MRFNWSDVSRLSQELADEARGGADEARYRNVVGRAYYGAFGQVRAFLSAQRHWVRADDAQGSHQAVQTEIARWGRRRPETTALCASTSERLSYLHRRRKRADYDAEPACRARDMEAALAEAAQILAALDQVRKQMEAPPEEPDQP